MVKINGKTPTEMHEIKTRTEDGKRIILEIGPGTYQFEYEVNGK
jgi:hypothetical protein